MEPVIFDLFAQQCARAPEAVAVFDERRTLSRQALYELSGTVAAMLPADAKRVGIVMDHGVEMIAAIFGVLQAGAAYVPVEPFFPAERIRFMMRDAEVDCILTQRAYREKLSDFPLILLEPGLAPAPERVEGRSAADARDLAYILYTSGSTGTPKGVAVEQRNVCHYVRAFQTEFHPDDRDIMLQYSVCSFDIFVEEVFSSLLSGAALAIPSAETKASMERLMAFVEARGVTIISGFPYLLEEMNALPNIPDSLRLLISGGDVLRASYISNLVDKVPIYNTYGPSETTVCASYFRCTADNALLDGTFPVGTPVRGAQIQILDDAMRPVRPGEVGELCISGGGVSRGYIGDRALENRAFVTMPDGTRVYRSGDMGYALPDGSIAFLYRKDSQIMIYGKRVEPDEVENVLLRSEDVARGAVGVQTDAAGLAYMTAYVVPASPDVPLSTLRAHMEAYLPAYMVPEFFVRLDAIPLTPNGKIDRQALPVVMKG